MTTENRTTKNRHFSKAALLLAFTLSCVPARRTAAAEDPTLTITHGGLERSFIVHLPPKAKRKKGKLLPVVLNFHGGGGNAQHQIRNSGMNDVADREGFIVVYPNGTGLLPGRLLTFNAGACCGRAMRKKVDDVGFTRAMLDDLRKRYPVDPRRVFATGFSNGALMAYRLAAELPDRIAAIAPVSGPMGLARIPAGRAVPVMHFHGDRDENAPFKGGTGERSVSGTDFMSVRESLGMWIKHNGCGKKPAVTNLPDKDPSDGTTVTRETYSGGRDGSEVVLYIVRGGGHTWPGSPSKKRPLRLGRGRRGPGRVSRDINASELMWEFFKKHPMPAATATKGAGSSGD